MERRPANSEQRRASNFPQFNQVLEDFVGDRLPINKVQRLARTAKIVEVPDTWISSTAKNEEGYDMVKIGLQELPKNIRRAFGWGAETQGEQYVVKIAHEFAHVIQEEFVPSLLRFLRSDNTLRDGDIAEKDEPFIQLYAHLQEIRGLNGLSQMGLYHEQNQSLGAMNYPVYEDMAESIGSYLLGTEYFLYRIQNARISITQEQAEKLIEHIIVVVDTWEKRKGG